MAIDNTLPQIQACAMRVGQLDADGAPLAGANNLYTSDALSELQLTPVYEDGDEITEKNACGKVAINFKGAPSFKRGDVSLTIMTEDPYLVKLLGLGSVLANGGNPGYAFPDIGSIESNGVSIELWARRIDDGAPAADFPWAWWVLPRVVNLKQGVRNFSNGARLPVFTGEALENPNWLDGPANDWPVASTQVAQWVPTEDLPVLNGSQALVAS